MHQSAIPYAEMHVAESKAMGVVHSWQEDTPLCSHIKLHFLSVLVTFNK